MAVIIKKGRSAQAAEPIQPRPVRERRDFCAPVPYYERKIAQNSAELYANPNTMRAPTPTVCTFCGHPYSFPCEGKAATCMNAKFIRDREAQA